MLKMYVHLNFIFRKLQNIEALMQQQKNWAGDPEVWNIFKN